MRLLPTIVATMIVAALPLSARAQDAPTYAVPNAAASADEQIHGRIISFDGSYDVRVDDERGFVDRVRLHDGTIINPTGLTLAPGMVVSVLGYNAGGYFSANEIDTPYTSNDGGWYYRDHPYDYYGSSVGLSFFFGDIGWWHGADYRGYGNYGGYGGHGHGGHGRGDRDGGGASFGGGGGGSGDAGRPAGGHAYGGAVRGGAPHGYVGPNDATSRHGSGGAAYHGTSVTTGGYTNPIGGGYHAAPSMGGGYRAAPSMGGGYHAAPSMGGGYRAAPSMGGGYHAAPSMGGGYRAAPSMGGGFHAAPATSGGGVHGGGGSRPH